MEDLNTTSTPETSLEAAPLSEEKDSLDSETAAETLIETALDNENMTENSQDNSLEKQGLGQANEAQTEIAANSINTAATPLNSSIDATQASASTAIAMNDSSTDTTSDSGASTGPAMTVDTKIQQEPDKTETTNRNDTADDNDDDDVASKAAVALAAVAAAASASHKSPAEAAKEARAVAQSFITNAAEDPAAKADLQTVSMESIKATKYVDNKSFLRTLLLLERFRVEEEEKKEYASNEEASAHGEQTETINNSATAQESKEETDDKKRNMAAEASERLEIAVKRVDGAYDSLVNLLPQLPENIDTGSGHFDQLDIDPEALTVVPDLLPPCAPLQGDLTVAFFRACLGEAADEPPRRAFGAEDQPATVEDESSISNSLDQPSVTPPREEPAPAKPHSSLLSSILRKGNPSALFRRKNQKNSVLTPMEEATVMNTLDQSEGSNSGSAAYRPDEYQVTIEREMLGLTVENVLERTVVRTVAPTGPAKKAGAKVGSLIVQVGNVETRNLTHFETIDELRQSNRPLHLILRQIEDDALRAAREEMGRLIKGAGFGNILEGRTTETADATVRPLIESDLRIDAYTSLVRRRFAEARGPVKNKKEEALAKAGEKLVWILALFVVGLQREAERLYALAEDVAGASPSKRNPHSQYNHTAKDYEEASKSVSKVLYDYTRKKLDPLQQQPTKGKKSDFLGIDATGVRKSRKVPLQPPVPGSRRGKKPASDSSVTHEKPLMQIGDVLQRTRTFLADTTSPPAALLRGELIGFLCDVLDLDTEMELSEEEGALTAGGAADAGINDLGSAGSLLKLIVLNCPVMRSPGCEEITSRREALDPDIEAELKRRFGTNDEHSNENLHRLHAGNRFLAVVHRLAASRSTSARITACSLGPVLWGHLDFPHQLQLRGVITRALHDVDVMVRKATATVLHEIAELVFDPRAVPWLVLMCERAMTDPEPQLRSAAMTLTWHLAEHLPNAFLGDASQGSRYLRRLPSREDPTFAEVYLLQCKLLPVATRLAEDRSPSVRLAVAAQCDRLCDALGAHWSSVVIDTLLALLSDTDERVRCEAVSCVPRLSRIVLLSTPPGETAPSEVSVLEALIPATIKLQKDNSVSVRAALAAAAGDLLTLLVALQNRSSDEHSTSDTDGGTNYKKHVDDRLIPMVQTLLNDSEPEVTSSALRAVTNATRSSLHQSRSRHLSVASEDDSASISSYASHASREKPVFLPVLSEVQVLRLLPTLTELGNSKQWRVRQSAVEIVPALLGCTQKLETRSEIAKLCIRLMGDKVDAVRKTAAECLCMGGSSLGSHGEDASAEWISSIVIPNIRKSAIHTDSKQRLLSLKMVEVVLLSGSCPTKWKGSLVDEDRMSDSPIRELAAIALSLATDQIANVRLNVGRCLETVIGIFEEEEIAFIQEVVKLQMETEKTREGGGDRDVMFFANRCLERATAVLQERITS